MIKSNPTPCSDWALKLSARHPDDLSPSDRKALREHLACCRACSQVQADYQTMEDGIRGLLTSAPEPVLSYQLTQRAKEKAPASRFSLAGLIALVPSAFASVCMIISWSGFFQLAHTWLLTAITNSPRKVSYVHSNNSRTFAIRSDSGFFLWQHEGYQNHEIISTLPMRWSRMNHVVRVLPMSGL